MNKKELRHTEKMSMMKFLRRYYGFTNEKLLTKLSKLSHKQLKEIVELYDINIRKISFDDLTREMIASGEVILVTDRFDNPAPYINPEINLENEYLTTLDESFVQNIKIKERRK